MIISFGYVCLILSSAIALSLLALPRIIKSEKYKTAFVEFGAVLQFILVLFSFISLVYAFVIGDLSVLNVALNSNQGADFIYKITGVWGSHEGSMLLWLLILTCFTALFAIYSNINTEFKIRVIITQAVLSLGFNAFILLTSNPFVRLDTIPKAGIGLNPLLEDPAFAIHPPVLFIGYVGCSLAFSYAVASLIEGRINDDWARCLRPWVLGAWSFLTLGIGLGAWWAYYELGWGGWWFWDPVENAALMPWLLSTALLHTLIVVEKNNALHRWGVTLALCTFLSSLLGTFLVRAGLLTSVHNFAADKARGNFILAILLFTVFFSFALLIARYKKLQDRKSVEIMTSSGFLIFNNIILSTITGIVFFGTLYPLFLELLTNDQVSVGAAYFNNTVLPFALLLPLMMGFVPVLGNTRILLANLWRKCHLQIAVAMLVCLIAGYTVPNNMILAPVAIGIAAWLMVTHVWAAVTKNCITPYMVAHFGLGLMIFGMCEDVFFLEEKTKIVQVGDSFDFEDSKFYVENMSIEGGPYYQRQLMKIKVEHNGSTFYMTPEKRLYPLREMITTETALAHRGFSDIYMVLGEFQGDGKWSLKVSYHKLVSLIWLGVILMFVAGMFAMLRRAKLNS